MSEISQPPPGVTEALKDCLNISGQLVTDRIELLEYDLRAGFDDTVRRGARYSLAGLFALGGAGALAFAGGLLLSNLMPPPAAAALMGLTLLGVAALVWPGWVRSLRPRSPPGGKQ